MSAYNTMTQSDQSNVANAYFEVDAFRKEFFDRIKIVFKKNKTYRFMLEYSENKFETTSKFIGSPTHKLTDLVAYDTKAKAVTNYIEHTTTYEDGTCFVESSNLATKKRFIGNSFRLHAVYYAGYDTLYVSEFYPVLYSIADVFYGRQINLSESVTIATSNSKENVLHINKDGFKMWGFAGNLHANIGLQDDGSYGAWFPRIRAGGNSWSGAPLKILNDGSLSISTSESTTASLTATGSVKLATESGSVTIGGSSDVSALTSLYVEKITGYTTGIFGNTTPICTIANDGGSYSAGIGFNLYRTADNWRVFTGGKYTGLLYMHGSTGSFEFFAGTAPTNSGDVVALSPVMTLTNSGVLTLKNNIAIYSGSNINISLGNDGHIGCNSYIDAGGYIKGSLVKSSGWLIANVNQDCNNYGIELWGGQWIDANNFPRFGFAFRHTNNGGTHGNVNGDYATYLTMGNEAGRGWIFRDTMTPANVASISNTGNAYFNGTVKCGGIDVNINTTGSSEHRIWLYPVHTYPMYIQACSTSNYGAHGYVTGDWATYFGMSDDSGNGAWRGWVFRSAYSRGNVASISCEGNMALNGRLTVGSAYGISFNNEIWQGRPLYGMRFEQPSSSYCGSYGNVTVNAIYFSTYRYAGYGWIWQSWADQNTPINVASLDAYGNMTLGGQLSLPYSNTIRQTNTAWGATLQIGYDINASPNITTNAFIGASNGNLHMDCQQGAFQMYLNYYSKGAIYLQNTAENGGITIDNGGMLFSNNLNFANTTDKSGNANIHLGSIRGKFANELIHLYRRVNIGYPSGWGGMDAPEYGLSTYGSAFIGASDVSALLRIGRYTASDKFAYITPVANIDCGLKFQTMYADGSYKTPLQLDQWGMLSVTCNNPAPSTISYCQCSIQLITTDSSCPMIGFHRANASGIALYSAGGDGNNILRIRTQVAGDYALLHEGNYPPNNGGWLAPALASLGATKTFGTNYGGGEIGYAFTSGNAQLHVYCDGKFWQNEGNYACVDTSGATFSNQLIINSATYGAYNEGIRLNCSANGYATLLFGAKDSTSGMVSGSDWTIIRSPNGSLRITSVNSDSGGAQFCTDNSLYNTGNIVSCANLGVAQTNGGGAGLSLYNGAASVGSYGVMFATTGNFGTHGYVNQDWATYFTMAGQDGRGWIFRNATSGVNVASISNIGNMVLNGNLCVGSNSAPTITPFWVGKKVGATTALFGQTDQCPVMMYQYSADYTGIAFNAYHNGTSWYNLTGNKSTFLIQHEPLNGELDFYGAPAVTAGGVPQLVKAFSIGTDGTVGYMRPNTGWVNLTINSSAGVSHDVTYSGTPACIKDVANIVHFRGCFRATTTLSAGTLIATIPQYSYFIGRPSKKRRFSIPYVSTSTDPLPDNTTFASVLTVLITPDGYIYATCVINPNVVIDFSGISYYFE